jgi:hypothetical protein
MPPCAATVWLRVGKHFGQAGCLQAFLRHAEGGAQPSAASADHDHIVIMMN